MQTTKNAIDTLVLSLKNVTCPFRYSRLLDQLSNHLGAKLKLAAAERVVNGKHSYLKIVFTDDQSYFSIILTSTADNPKLASALNIRSFVGYFGFVTYYAKEEPVNPFVFGGIIKYNTNFVECLSALVQHAKNTI